MQNTELPSSLPSAQTRQPCSEKADRKDADATKLDKKANLFPIMNYVQEKEQALLEGWLTDHKNFESILRLAIQEVESVKLDHPYLNVSDEYHLGKLDGYTEAFEALFRVERKEESSVIDPPLKP